MAWVVPFLLLAWPVAEIAAFVAVVRWVGLFGALAGILLSGLIGAMLLRMQGFATAQRVRTQMTHGRMPVDALFDGACLAVSGILFLLPGFVSDVVAAILLLPPVRQLLRFSLGRRLRAAASPADGKGPTVIEGEWEVVEPDDDKPPPDDRPHLPRG